MTTGILARLNVFLGADATELNRAIEGIGPKLQAAGRSMQSVGRRMSTRVTLPLAAIGAASVKMASDAEEAGNKFNVVMGDSAERVRDRLQELTKTIPLTRTEMERLAGGIQDMLVPMGLARDDAADMSAGMVELAGDIASFNNVPTDQALNAMQSALAGQSQPLRQFGIDVSVARLEALALEEGLIDSADAFDATARAQAIAIAIQRDSTDAMGDAARTADSTANSMRFVMRDVKQLGITIGEILIPAVTPLIQAVGRLVAWMTELSPTTQKVIVAVAAFAAAIGPLALVFGTILTMLPAMVAGFTVLMAVGGPILLGVAAIGALVAAGRALIKNWGVIQFEVEQLVLKIQEWLGDKLGAVIGRVQNVVEGVAGAFSWLSDRVVGNSIVPDMVDAVGEEFARLGGIMDQSLEAVIAFAQGSDRALERFVQSAIRNLAKIGLGAILPGGGLLSGVFGGFFADGGFLGPGQFGIVGEAGPELIQAGNRGATVTPMQEGGASLNLTVNVPPARDLITMTRDREWRRAIDESLSDARDRGVLD